MFKNLRPVSSKVCLFPVIFGFFAFSAGAYIPSYPFLLSRLAKGQGRGACRIEQTLVFKSGDSPLTLTETWHVLSGGRLRLDLKFPQEKDLYARFIYRRQKKIFRNEKGLIQNIPIPLYHLERPFHLRSAEKLKKLFSLWKLAPLFPPEREEGTGSDPFVRLSRKGGLLQYELGRGGARLWLEQDEFVISRFKWAGGELKAWDYKFYPGLMFFPGKRLFRVNQQEVLIKTLLLKKIKMSKKLLSRGALKRKNRFPADFPDWIREFYKQFR